MKCSTSSCNSIYLRTCANIKIITLYNITIIYSYVNFIFFKFYITYHKNDKLMLKNVLQGIFKRDTVWSLENKIK